MIHRFLCCLAGLLAAAWLAHAEPPDGAPPVQTEDQIIAQETELTQPDPNAPWPTSSTPAYSSSPWQGAGPNVIATGAQEPPGFLPEPMATQSMGPSETMFPVQPARPRWSGLFGRTIRNPPEYLPDGSEPPQGNVSQLPAPTPGAPSSPTEPLQMPTEAQPAAELPVEGVPLRPPGQFWLKGEFLLWQEPAGRLATPLVTTGSTSTTQPPGAMGNSDTSVLFSTDNQLKYGNLPGARATFGGWFTRDWIIGAEVSAFWVGSTSISQEFTPDQTSTGVLARPFTNALTGNTSSAVVSFPGAFSGTLHVDSQSRLFGAEANLIGKLCREEHYDVDVIVGYRYMELSESLQFNQAALTAADGVLAFNNVLLPAGTTVTFFDRFETRNEFQGLQIGIQSTHHAGPVYLQCFAKFAVGPLERIIDNNGLTTMTPAGGTTSSLPGGIFVVPPANLGRFTDVVASFVTHVGFHFGYHWSDWCEIFAGYEIVVMPEAVRASDQVNPLINPELIPTFLGYNPNATPIAPAVSFLSRAYWAQGINVGIGVKW